MKLQMSTLSYCRLKSPMVPTVCKNVSTIVAHGGERVKETLTSQCHHSFYYCSNYCFLSESKLDLQISHGPSAHSDRKTWDKASHAQNMYHYTTISQSTSEHNLPFSIHLFNCFDKVNHFPIIIQGMQMKMHQMRTSSYGMHGMVSRTLGLQLGVFRHLLLHIGMTELMQG